MYIEKNGVRPRATRSLILSRSKKNTPASLLLLLLSVRAKIIGHKNPHFAGKLYLTIALLFLNGKVYV